MDYSLPGSFVHITFQARILEWVAISTSKVKVTTLIKHTNSEHYILMDVRVTIKKAEHQRIDAFELWCWRRLLRVPWTARRSNQSLLKEISPEYSLEELMLKLKLQYFGHLM